jgi:hypothetical protein
MRDERKAPRSASKTQAVAMLASRSELECTIRDLSATGARLSFRHPTFLPKTFRLQFGAEDQRVTVIWQRGLFAGVRFQTPLRMPAPKKKKFLLWA